MLAALATACLSCAGARTQTNPFTDESSHPPAWDLMDVEWQLPLVDRRLLEYAPMELAGPAVDEASGRVVVVTRDGTVHCVSPQGKREWTFKTAVPFSAGPSIYSGVTYVPGGDGTLYALDLKTGGVRWKFTTGQELGTPPVLVDGVVYFASHADTVFAIDASNGAWKWQYRRDPPVGFTVRGMATPRIEGGVVYAGFSDGSVVALKADDGGLKWERPLGSGGSELIDVDGGPILDGEGGLYVASYKEGVYALEAENGNIRWHSAQPGVTSLLQRAGVIYTAGEDEVGALLRDNGRAIWTLPLKETAARLPVAAPQGLLVPVNHALLLVDPVNGRTGLAWDPGAGISAPVARVGNRVYVLSNQGFLYAMTLKASAG